MRAVFKLETLQTSPANKITEKVRKTCEMTTFEKNKNFFIIHNSIRSKENNAETT